MATGQRKPPSAVGFLTVLEHSQHGLMGGYLVLNIAGRPLEFHCTAPVKPNRAQQILYGPTLEPYLYGEQIGQALVSKSSLEPLVIFTDRAPSMAVRMVVDVPLALVLPRNDSSVETAANPKVSTERIRWVKSTGSTLPMSMQAGHDLRRSLSDEIVWRYRPIATPIERRSRSGLTELAESFDLAEPFDRIREAIEEAQRVGR